MTSRNNKTRRVKTATNKQLFSYLFRCRIPQQSSSRAGAVTISENDLNKSSFFRCHLWSHVLLKNQVFSTYPKTSDHEKTLFSATKTEHFHVLSKKEDQKSDQKTPQK